MSRARVTNPVETMPVVFDAQASFEAVSTNFANGDNTPAAVHARHVSTEVPTIRTGVDTMQPDDA